MADSRIGVGNIQYEPGAFCDNRKKKKRSKNKIKQHPSVTRLCQNDRSQLNGQSWSKLEQFYQQKKKKKERNIILKINYNIINIIYYS